ncbi:MAG: preprotein translocase subunit SecG [Planctomycetota bacterium]|nr:preprotein translocase subunit SecG [Planctomycetaceae bacterium]MDQ3329706.1 preprotein translocase subunit SecG [Planctomycetota bacterium]
MSYLWSYLAVAALTLTCFLLIFIILLQRGRGGGLAGAFGGAGGQSALGTKAGDVFTKITVGLAIFWVLLACLSIYALRSESENRIRLDEGESQSGTLASGGEDADEAELDAEASPAGKADAVPPAGGDNGPTIPDTESP